MSITTFTGSDLTHEIVRLDYPCGVFIAAASRPSRYAFVMSCVQAPVFGTIIRFHKCNSLVPNAGVYFPECRIAFFDKCHPDFLYYWIYRGMFPCLESIYINSNPHSYALFMRLPLYKWRVVDKWQKWFPPSVSTITQNEYSQVLAEHDQYLLQFFSG